MEKKASHWRQWNEIEVVRRYGGEGGIRTPGRSFPLRRFSKPLLSTTQPPLRVCLSAPDFSALWSMSLYYTAFFARVEALSLFGLGARLESGEVAGFFLYSQMSSSTSAGNWPVWQCEHRRSEHTSELQSLRHLV